MFMRGERLRQFVACPESEIDSQDRPSVAAVSQPFGVQSKRVGTRQSISSLWTFQYSNAAVGSRRSSDLAPLAQWLPALSVKLITAITRDPAGDPPSLTSTIAPPLLGTLIAHRPGGRTPIMTRYSGS